MATLLVIHGNEQGRRYAVSEPVMRIGRDASNPVRLPDNEISRQHAEIRHDGDGYSIVDLDSSNGIYVNGRRVPQARLETGDRVQLGQTVFLFGAGTTVARADLAKKITMITQAAAEQASAIVRTISQEEGSQFLRRKERADPAWLEGALAHLRVLYETSRAVSHIVDLDELLARILELAFQSVKADRGCVLLCESETSVLECRAVHYGPDADRERQIEVSQTIVDYVLSKGEGVRTSDAAADARFTPAKSIVRMGITEAVCVPIQGRHAMLGVLYVDRRTPIEETLDTPKPGTLTDEHLKLLAAIGHQAALAIEDTRHYEALVQSERLAAVGQTIATLSHHIKNILQGIKGGSHLIEMGLDGGETDQVRRGWNIVNKNQNKIYNLVMDMLSYSKEREPAFETADFNEVVSEVVELMEQRAAELGVELELATDAAMPKIAIDPEGIHRAVLNIVANALDATDQRPDGRVQVRTEFDSAAAVARVYVEDNGAGIPPDELGQIFALFASTKGIARGTGIGLPVSEKIIKEHGGTIQVRSQPGAGTEFIIEVPAREEEP